MMRQRAFTIFDSLADAWNVMERKYSENICKKVFSKLSCKMARKQV